MSKNQDAAAELAGAIRDGVVVVRALEWSNDFAHTEFGLFYHLSRQSGSVVLEKHEVASVRRSFWPSEEEAKAAAQADFEQRVRSCILPAERDQTVGDEELVEAWIKRGEDAHRTLDLKAAEAAKGHDWVVAHEVIQCADLVALADYLCTRQPAPSPAPAAPDVVEMVDAAMVEMANIHPPLRRNECERLITAALAKQAPSGAVEPDIIAALSDNEGVCLGGKWKGWLFRRHPDGQWVSVRKLDEVDPMKNNPFAMLAAASSQDKEQGRG